MSVEDRESVEAQRPEEGDSNGGTSIRLPVDISGFSGPLDLLVHLITKKEMDVFSVSLAEITDSFLVAIRASEEKDLDQAGEYLVLAATLVRYKSRSLVPRQEEEEEEEEEISDELLRRRQREYERFREAAQHLREREKQVSSLFPRLGPTAEQPEEVVEFAEVSVYDLYSTFKRILEEIGTSEVPAIPPDEFSVDEKMLEIESFLRSESDLLLTAYLRTLKSRIEIIVVFLALLELIRLKIVRARQETRHGEIWLERGPGRSEMSDWEIHEMIDDEPVAEHRDTAAGENPESETKDNGDSGTQADH